jgi:hypothetical protein
MKKFFVITLATALCLALAMPAMAKVTVGGRATLEWSYNSQDEEFADGGVDQGDSAVSNGFDEMNFVVPFTLNRLNAKYTSDDGAISGFVELRGGGSTDTGTYFGSYNAVLVYAWIQWQVTPTHSITFGRQTSNFARGVPNQWVGTHVTTILGVGFGNVNHTTERTGIKGYWRISDMLGLVWGLYDNSVWPPNAGASGAPSSSYDDAVTVSAQENTLPRVDLALPIRFPWGKIEPSATWSKMEYDQVHGEDSYDIYGLAVEFAGSWGMFSAGAELTWGKNLGGGSYRGAEGGRPVFYLPGNDPDAQWQVEDADVLAFYIDVGFKFGPSKVNVMYGQIDYENDGDPTLTYTSDPAEFEYTQSFYGISWAIGVAKGFTIRPELMFYDYDKDAIKGGTIVNEGKEWLLGLQFMLVF